MFFTFLFVGTVTSIFYPKKDYSDTENRYLAKRPTFSIPSLLDGTLISNYETYLSDQFPFRNQWIGLKISCDRALLKQDSNGIYFSKDNYYIECQKASKFLSKQAKSNSKILTKFVTEQVEQLGNKHIRVAIIPTASEILKDKLPLFASPYDQSLLLNDLEKSLPPSVFINTETVLETHNQENIFYHTDHHWTSLGSFYFYEAWAKSIGIPSYPSHFFTKEVITKQFLGTLHSKLNISTPPDSIILYKPNISFHYKLNYVAEKRETNSLYDMSALKEKDKYKLFLGGNHARIDIKTTTDAQKYTPLKKRHLLIIKDSFSHSFAPFAVNHFERTTLLDLRFFIGSLSDFIRTHDVTDILILYNTSNFVSDSNIKKMLQ